MRDQFLPFHLPAIDEADIAAVVDVLKSRWLTTGAKAKAFEEAFAGYVGSPHAVAVNSGTAALHLALAALGIGPDDEVIIPTMTFAATGEVVLYCGARPVLADSTVGTFNLDPGEVQRCLTHRTRAILPVHMAGQPCEMDAILEIARSRGIAVVEDAAHALPARYRDRMVGAIGDVTCFSFYATKTLTTGEGGMATTADPDLAEKIRTLSLHGISRDAWKRYTAEGTWYYEILMPGYKYNMPDIQAALGLAQLARCDAFWARRGEIAAAYSRAFQACDALEAPAVEADRTHAWHLYILRLRPGALVIDRRQFIEELRARRIGTSVHFIPLHLHPYYRETYGYVPGDFPRAEDTYRRCLSLPIYPSMTDRDVQDVIAAVLDVAASFRRPVLRPAVQPG